jgi:hypothetical protein
MDTRFWGPPAWKLLHTVAAAYEPTTQGRRHMSAFLEVLPYVLPCKFCRSSLTEHYRKLPYRGVAGALTGREQLERWMYKLHNLVNETLREQGQTIPPAPAFELVQAQYRERLPNAAAPGQFPAWDFLFAVAYIYPPQMHETPLPDAPKCPAHSSDCEKNRWNFLSTRRRLQYWLQFWKVLPGVLPVPWRFAWENAVRAAHPSFTGRRAAVASLWRIRCAFESDKEDPYTEVCDRLLYHSSGCGAASRRAKTCRRLEERRRTRKHKAN